MKKESSNVPKCYEVIIGRGRTTRKSRGIRPSTENKNKDRPAVKELKGWVTSHCRSFMTVPEGTGKEKKKGSKTGKRTAFRQGSPIEKLGRSPEEGGGTVDAQPQLRFGGFFKQATKPSDESGKAANMNPKHILRQAT